MSGTLFTRAELYPVEIRFDVGLVVFVAATRARYDRASFLDGRFVRRDETVYLGKLERLLARFEQEQPPPRPLHFVAHTAFCCSTLLARCLGELRRCLVLREPSLLVQVDERREPGEAWERLLAFATGLLARTFADDETALVKLNDRCNGLVPGLLARHPESRGILLYGDLDSFLTSVLRDPGRRIWLREHRLPLVRADAERCAPLAGLDPERLTDAEAAAYLWLYRLYTFGAWADHPELGPRLALVSASDFLERRRETLGALVRHLALPADQEELDEAASSPLLDRYAKDPSQLFDAGAEQEARRRLGPEIDAGRALAEAVLALHPALPGVDARAVCGDLEPHAGLADALLVGVPAR